MHFDYLIIGQGLAGSFLSWNLNSRGKKILVIDEARPFTASRVASGVINPVTGRRMVRTWMIETLMPFAVDAYTRFGHELGTELISQCNIIDFHTTPQMKLAFAECLPEEGEYLRPAADENKWRAHLNYAFGYGEIDPCWLVNLSALLPAWRSKLSALGALSEEKFRWEDCIIEPGKIRYQNHSAEKILFCEGVAGFDNPYFRLLPYARNKGEALIVEIPGLPRNHIFKQGMVIAPWKDDTFWVGSSYEWDFTDDRPSEAFRKKTGDYLQQVLKHPYKTVDHIAAERPANMERRPFVGLHPLMPSVGILNGMGTKGCSLAPYFAAQFTDHLLGNTAIEPAANVQRFSRILSR
ncbi:NAD(P)/FAD-dependent oxidoreductase [Sediminibacterium soli]|uniref:NAD(P)/FAD-dependent oxidoreductase n=1 Tax=Sediminibacterium soli TaxID=2698829 RepID=UPI00137A1D2A|nr:FAD-binding oxidoreductase [Sediminibacterium soli]NCI47949.1 FAD-binding oxidoreductase [Sediminibacterium soli]